MDKSLLPANSLKPPKKFFADPPLIGNERLEDYKLFFAEIAAAAKPLDFIAWLFVRDMTDVWWEIRREKKILIEIIKQKQRESAFTGLTRADFIKQARLAEKMSKPTDEDDEPSRFRLKDSPPIEKEQEDPIASQARVYLHGGGEIEASYRRIAALEFRRNTFLREVERRNLIVARNADKAASDIVDAEFTEPGE